MDDGLLQVVLNAPGASWIAALLHEERTKNEKKDTRERDKIRVKRCRLICSIVCCCSIGHHLFYLRGGWTSRTRYGPKFPSKESKKTSQIWISKIYPNLLDGKR